MLYIIPSRGRPHKAAELLEAWRETTVDATPFFVIDQDDPKLDEYIHLFTQVRQAAFVVVPTGVSNGGMVGPVNYAAEQLHDVTDYLGFMGDDHRPRTASWDTRMEAVMKEERVLFAYGDDKMQGRNLPTAVLMDARVVEKLGFMAPECLTHLYVDNYWRSLGEMTNSIRYVPDVVIEHVHPAAGKTDWDDEYRRVNAGSMYAKDGEAFGTYIRDGHLAVDAQKIMGLL